jgi:hypothetical protein
MAAIKAPPIPIPIPIPRPPAPAAWRHWPSGAFCWPPRARYCGPQLHSPLPWLATFSWARFEGALPCLVHGTLASLYEPSPIRSSSLSCESVPESPSVRPVSSALDGRRIRGRSVFGVLQAGEGRARANSAMQPISLRSQSSFGRCGGNPTLGHVLAAGSTSAHGTLSSEQVLAIASGDLLYYQKQYNPRRSLPQAPNACLRLSVAVESLSAAALICVSGKAPVDVTWPWEGASQDRRYRVPAFIIFVFRSCSFSCDS